MASFEKRIRKNGAVRWRAAIRKRGAARSRTFSTLEHAKEWAARIDAALDAGRLPRNKTALIRSQRHAPLKPGQLLQEAEIVVLAEKFRFIIGVYFLLRANRVVYVGQSQSVYERILRHIRDGTKDFDSYAWIEEPPNRLDIIETQYIEALRPEYNFDGDGVLRTPVNSMELNLRRGNVSARVKRDHIGNHACMGE